MGAKSKPSPLGDVIYGVVRRIPRVATTRAVGKIVEARVPKNIRPMIYGSFASLTGVDTAEQLGDFKDFESLGDYFARPLRSGIREWPSDSQVVPAACDGELASLSSLGDGQLPIVKGHRYSLAEFLGDTQLAKEFLGGSQYTIYLSPRDYHRVHVPERGTVTQVQRLGADLWPVRPDVLRRRPQAFVENERVLFHIQTDRGHRAILAMVGATIVGSVVPSVDQPTPYSVARGEELGQFRLGSTVVYMTESPLRTTRGGVDYPRGIHMGDAIAELDR